MNGGIVTKGRYNLFLGMIRIAGRGVNEHRMGLNKYSRKQKAQELASVLALFN